MNVALWVLQIVFGLYFTFIGVLHFVVPQGLPAAMGWMYELSPTLHLLSGSLEILGGLGLILPGLTKIQTRLTPLAGAGLALVMLGAAVWHLQRGETTNIVLNIINGAGVALIAYGRWKLVPLRDRNLNEPA